MEDKHQKEELNIEEEIEFEKEIDQEALSVILRLYDKTIKDLVDR